MGPYLLAFSFICGILCYGLMRRPVWMWYFGWVFLFLFAGYFCQFFFGAMIASQTHLQVVFSLVYLAGGLVLWMPSAMWWIKIRPQFSARF